MQAPATLLNIRVAACSERGARAVNEDAIAAHPCGPGWYAVLADGAGGHRHGAEASRRAVSRMQTSLGDATLPWHADLLTLAVMSAHDEVRRGQNLEDEHDRMHTTVVALCVDARRGFALWTHVGDSRLYRLRHGAIDMITRDDSLVQRLLDAGMLTPAQALEHPHKNQLVAALGIDDALEPHTAAPQRLEDGDAFLLCSDGWWGSVGDPQIVASLLEAESPEQWLDSMRTTIEARGLPNQDNFSAIALWVGDPAETTRVMDLQPD